ncbi:MAG: potassium channel family protein [Solirubrobacterales bacterium]
MESKFERPMFFVALLVVPAVVIEFGFKSPVAQAFSLVLNFFCWSAFAVEWATLVWVSPDRLTWIRRHSLETAIVFLAVPILVPSAGALRLLRLSRLLRLVWVGKKAKQITSLEGLPYVALTALLVVVGAGAAFSWIEQTPQRHMSVWEGLWWASSTVTTVGYGDETPHTTAGKILALCVMLIGIGFVAILTGAVAQHFVAGSREVDSDEERHAELLERLREITERLERLEGQGANSTTEGGTRVGALE